MRRAVLRDGRARRLGLVLQLGVADGHRHHPRRAAGGAPEVAAKHFLDTYVKSNGRVARTDQDDDTVGEGQAYGMLLAAAIGDEKRFDLIWDWTKENLRGDDGLIAFLWKNGKIVDPKPASDADLDAARALLTASCRFDRPELRERGDPAWRCDPGQRDDEGRGRAAAGRRPVGQDAEGHLQPELLLARHVRGAREGDRRCALDA